MSDCSRHTKQVAGISDMKLLAEAIGDLHYQTLAKLLDHLSDKLYDDAEKDMNDKRTRLGLSLQEASRNIASASNSIEYAWQISKPFMKDQ